MLIREFFLSVLIICAIPLFSSAEYRVFVLKIAKKTQPNSQPTAEEKPQPTDFRLVESTLDPEQYRYYYPVAADEDVTYIETWRCYGRTDNFKPHCSNPKVRIPTSENP